MTHNNLATKYQKMTPHQHILELPGMYIGSIKSTDVNLWVFNEEKMEKKDVSIVYGLYKIFDEILVNACDHHIRLKQEKATNQVTQIKVNIDQEKGEISVYNNGEGVPVAMHPEHNIYVPEMIFGNLLTSGNYDKDEKKIVGGMHGIGAKATSIYSQKFIVETVDALTKKKYIQEFSNNMYDKTEPKITSCYNKPYTKITFQPDLKRFSMDKLDDDIVSLMTRRVYDMTAITDPTVTVYFNDKKIECKQFEKYVDLYIGTKSERERIYEKVNDRWELVVSTSSDEEFEHVSFVNGIYTFKGGKHIDYVSTHIANKLSKYLANRGKNKIQVKAEYIKKNMFLFLKCSIENPSFSSQTKEELTTPSKDFGSKCTVSDKFIEKLAKTEIVERSLALGQHKSNMNLMTTTENKKKKTIRILNLDDATWAGTNKSSECTLILTEGLSAKATAIAGLSVVGREKFGVFPLKGKLLNVRDLKPKKGETMEDVIFKNEEIKNIIKIMGLQLYEFEVSTNGKKTSAKKTRKIYKDVSELRYGRIMCYTDQDVDGSHIKGLLMNIINTFWSELTEIEGFITSLPTPIVKVSKGKNVIPFYSLGDYETWKKNTEIKGWNIKYYKGLGTSTAQEGKEYFKSYEKELVNYNGQDEGSHDALKLAFGDSKTYSDDRKKWLEGYDMYNVLEPKQKQVSIKEFIDKDLIHFSNYDCMRSIPSMCDGFKPVQRKIMFSAFKRNLKSEIKVAQFAGYVSEHSAYHHGEASLHGAIIAMAQDFVGSNNINLLDPVGQFGTRLVSSGKDHASPRYIFTQMTDLASIMYNKMDLSLFEYLDDDGQSIEPKWYLPLIPTILVNGTKGIGTGFSTEVPCFNPLDLVKNIKKLMNNEVMEEMIPWYRGFEGEIKKVDSKKYECRGKYNFINDTTVDITELPIGTWSSNYIEKIDKLVIDSSVKDAKLKKKQFITDYEKMNGHTDTKVHLRIKMAKTKLATYKKNTVQFEKDFDLVANLNTGNMHLYNAKCQLRKYDNVEDILQEFYKLRLEYYLKRKLYWLMRMKKELDIMEAKIKFIQFVRDQKIDIRKPEEEIIAILEENDFPKFSNKESANIVKEEEEINQDEYTYDYLLKMQIRTLTQKVMEKMMKEHEVKMAEYKLLESKSDKDLWMEDLTEFEKVYEKMMKEYMAKQNETNGSSGKTVKKIVKKSVKVM